MPPPKHIPPPLAEYSGGATRRRELILAGLLLLTAVYFSFFHLLRESGPYLPPADEYCTDSTEGETCSRPDLFAFQVSSAIGIWYCGFAGFYVWHVSRRVHTKIPQTPEGRLFGYLDESEKLAAVNFTFQIWDFVISLLIPEHSTPVFLAHHAMAAVVSWFSVSYQVLHYYGIFFLGVTEISSVFLVIVDVGRYFPPVPGSPFDLLIAVCQPAFLVTFGLYRIILWWKVSVLLWSDVIYVLKEGIAEKYRPGKSYCLYIYLVLNMLLGILQVYWFGIILRAAGQIVFGVED